VFSIDEVGISKASKKNAFIKRAAIKIINNALRKLRKVILSLFIYIPINLPAVTLPEMLPEEFPRCQPASFVSYLLFVSQAAFVFW
jgi:hypothetical protein